MQWLLATAAISMLVSLILAWLATLSIYGKVTAIKRVFPVTHNLIRAHIDYLMMTALLGTAYFACIALSITLPPFIIALTCFGVLYNPVGFIVQAHNPKAGKSDDLLSRIMVCVGFLPTTIGFGYIFLTVLLTL